VPELEGHRAAARHCGCSGRTVAVSVVSAVTLLAGVVAGCASEGTTELGTAAPATVASAPVPTFLDGPTDGVADGAAAGAADPSSVSGAGSAAGPDRPSVDPPGRRLGIGPCPLFPADHVFNTPVVGLPVDPSSGRTVAAIGRERDLRYGFSSTVVNNSRRGYPINVVDPSNSTPTDFMVAAVYLYFSNGKDVPMPAAPRFEGWPSRQWDKHLLLLDTSTCRTRELLNVQPPGENDTARPFNMWYADAVVSFDLTSNAYPNGSANAAGVSMFAGLVRYDEVAAGRINHALAIGMSEISPGEPIWPAYNTDGRSTNPDAPRMGSRFRLRSDVDISTLGPQARVVAEALRDYGAIVVDTGPGITITGEPDLRWNDADLAGLASLGADDLELVDVSSMIVDPSTHQARRRV